MNVVLGVDGGNTKTIALLARADGTIVGTGRGGCCDHYGLTTPTSAYDEVASAVRGALASAGASPGSIVASAFSLAGADWPEDIARYRSEIAARVPFAVPVVVVNDAIGALRGGTSDGVGVAIACGTGTAIGARGPDGRSWHVGMWGQPSFRYSLTRAAIDAAVRAELGITEPTLLQQLVPAAVGYATVEELLRAMSLLGEPRPSLGPTAVALLDAAARGDPTAVRAITEVAGAIVETARAAAAHAGLASATPVVLAGGVFRHPCDALVRAIAGLLPQSEIVKARFEPAAGALLLAFDELGEGPDLSLLAASLPPVELFASVG